MTPSETAKIQKLLGTGIFDLLAGLGSTIAEKPHREPVETPSERTDLFLSYARADRALVEDLFDKLTADGFAPWMDVRSIRPGERWRPAIEKALREAHFFVLCISSQSVNRRGFLQREIRMALDKTAELLEDDIYFLPVRLSHCPLPQQLTDFQAVDLFEPEGYPLLIAAIREGYRRRPRNA